MNARLSRVLTVVLATSGLLLSSCSNQGGNGELTGVPGRKPWYDPQPYGTVYIPTGTFHMGQSEEDITNALTARPRQVSIQAFYMDDTEITNNEYRQFVYYVRDSIVAITYGQEPYVITDNNGGQRIDWEEASAIDYEDEQIASAIQSLYYDAADQITIPSFNVDKFEYVWRDVDLQRAAQMSNKLNPAARREFIVEHREKIYPDTLTFIRDFTYAYNDPMAQTYFYHPAFDDYPVVGVSWKQAKAFCAWRTNYTNAYFREGGDPAIAPFRLPIESEWEYAARGGRKFSLYPWGGPYTRNSKGCFLLNFKPLRGDYPADGGFYPVRATAYFPNDYGLYNMAGNVSEWCSSAFEESIYNQVHDENPNYEYNAADDDPASLKRKVVRGGSWKDVAYYCQNATRSYEYQDTAKSYVGFRTARTYLGRSIRDRIGSN